MSTGLECDIRELAPGAWYYVLQRWTCPVGASDWRDESPAVVGPYASAEAAEDGLGENEANPGGWNVVPFREGDKRNAQLLAAARRPRIGGRR